MKELFIKIAFNIFLILIIMVGLEYGIYRYYSMKYNPNVETPKFEHKVYPYSFYYSIKTFFNTDKAGRKPDGINYRNKKPIIIFGCSFAYGHYLSDYQTFSRKLSNILKCPVYNRAIPGTGLQQMYMQSQSNWFYETIKDANIIIYVMQCDNYRRMKIQNFYVIEPLNRPIFKIRNNKLILYEQKNKLIRYIENLYITKHIKQILINKYINDSRNAEKLTDEAMIYFIETRKELEKHFKHKIDFYVILYEDIPFENILIKKLTKNNFKTVSTKELTQEDLSDSKYRMQDNIHPTEKAWELLTPLIVKRFKLK